MPTSLRLRLLTSSQLFRFVAVSFLAVLFAIAWDVAYYQPRLQKLDELETRLTQLTARLADAEESARRLPSLVSQQHNLANSLLRFQGALPDELDVPELVRRLTDYATYSGVVLSSISHYDAKPPVEKTVAYGIRVSLSGRFIEILNFLRALDSDPQILIVEAPEFASANDGEVKTSLQVIALYNGGLK